MHVFDEMKREGHEQVLFCSDTASGLEAIIAIHSTRLGPALGGVRMWPYASFDDAVHDVLRLSKAMTYKAAVSGLALGGGKAVIRGDSRQDKTKERMTAFAKHVSSLGGRYIAAEDVGVGVPDIELFRTVTPHVAGFREEAGGTGDPSPMTAQGVFQGMQAAIETVLGRSSFSGIRIALQGIGKVGLALGTLLHAAGAKLFIADPDPERVAAGCRAFDADLLHPHEIYRVECDIFAPCALGGILNERTIPALSCKIVAGAANNQLQDRTAADLLQARGILYAPDYVINAGGLIQLAGEIKGASPESAETNIKKIYDRLKTVLTRAQAEGRTPAEIADHFAEERLLGKAS